MCNMEVVSKPVPTATNPLGAKGAGEAGMRRRVAGGDDRCDERVEARWACSELDMPATSERVWRAIQTARAK